MGPDTADTSLSLRGYGVSFGARVVLADVDLRLADRGVHVLMGPVKTGKSCLLQSLAGLYQGNAQYRTWGEARLGGEAIGARRPALVQQHAALLKGTVRDALLRRLRDQAHRTAASWDDTARQALQAHDLQTCGAALDRPLIHLPLQHRRAVGILAEVLAQPPLLMVDEPTYGLDERAAGWLIDWLADLGRQRPLLVVLHHQQQARRLARQIVLLGGGRVLAQDATERFFRHPANPWVEQFIRSGSLSIASPDARPQDLGAHVPAPPPLPPAALAATAEFRHAASTPVAPAPSGPVLGDAAPGLAPQRRLARLPAVSAQGVRSAASVGVLRLAEPRGPQGFHWIIPGQLAGSPEPGVSSAIHYDLDLLRRVGITDLVTLTERNLPQAALARHGLRNLHLPIIDRETPSIRQAYMLLHRMKNLIDAGAVLVVHCRAGIGRTGTVLAAWLIREGGFSAEAAIERLRRINRLYVQTPQQEEFLRAFEADLLLRL